MSNSTVSNSTARTGGRLLFAAIGSVLIVLLVSLLVSLRAARDSAAPPPDALTRDTETLRKESRSARVRQLFLDIKGRDPAGWDDASLRRWTQSPLGTHEIAARLRSERPLVGVHYFTWYRQEAGQWRNDATVVPAGAPMPALGWYNSASQSVMDAHIVQMLAAGVDFVIVQVIAELPGSWDLATQFLNRLHGTPLEGAVMLDGLYDAAPFAKGIWARKAAKVFTTHPNYFTLHGRPLLMLFAAPIDFTLPGIEMRNVYWAPEYAPAENRFNGGPLLPHDWPFWMPTPQRAVNGIVPVVPGYTDLHLGREHPMEHPRRGGRMYHDQWQRALAERPELIIVYSWNEHFEQTAIEPTDAWGDRYVAWTACYAAHARRGTTGRC